MPNDVFIKQDTTSRKNPYAGLPLLHLVGVSPKRGEIGIEIEVEGNKFPKSGHYGHNENDYQLIPSQWKFTHDGSLRGDDNAEYVLANPIMFNEVDKAVTDLWQMFSDYGSVLAESNRTSVHVHLNVQNFHINRLCAFVSMYFVVEELLTSWCGDHRVGNLFCLRGRDAPAIIRRLKEFFQRDGYGYEFSSGMHYAGLNPSAIHKFGSIEIRSLRGVNDPQVILDWVSVLERLYVLSEEFKDPREVVNGFSGAGPMAWLQNILGDKYSTILNNVPYTTDEVRDILYNGIRLAQDLCYCRDWSQFVEQKVEANPFGRKSKVSPAGVAPSAPSPVSVTHSAFHEIYSGITTAGSLSTWNGYSKQQLETVIGELYNNGEMTSHSYLDVMGYSVKQMYLYLQARGNLPTLEPEEEPEDDYEPDDDYYDEDDD